MLKDELLDLISEFEKETWKYPESDELFNDMDYIYKIQRNIKKNEDIDLKQMYIKISSLIGMMRFKYGYEGMIVQSNPDLVNLKNIIDSITINSDDIVNQYNYVSTLYSNSVSKIKNLDFIVNKHNNEHGEEGLYLAIESLKSLITNKDYRSVLNSNQIGEVIIDCMKLNEGISNIKFLENKYRDIISMIWNKSLSNGVENKDKFNILFSNISGGVFTNQLQNLLNRSEQSSCSLISNDFMEIYGSETSRIGLIYPNNSQILMASAYDLGSNVFGNGSVNAEKGTSLATPEVLFRIGKERVKSKEQTENTSSCYNEVLVDAKPCGVLILGFGENDLNINYNEALLYSQKNGLPLYQIDMMDYKDKLSVADKRYIAFHSLMSYFGLNSSIFNGNDATIGTNISKLVEEKYEDITNLFLTLKSNGNLSKENMCQALSNIMDMSVINEQSRIK